MLSALGWKFTANNHFCSSPAISDGKSLRVHTI
jgi:hypothetical protein